MVAFLNGQNSSTKSQVLVTAKEPKKSKRGGSSSNNSRHHHHSDHHQDHEKRKTSSKKLAKITSSNGTGGYGGHRHQITSPARQKRHPNPTPSECIEHDENLLFQQQQKQQQKLLRQQQKKLNQQQNNIWINRRTNQVVYNEEEYDNDSDLQQQQVFKIKSQSKHSIKSSRSNNDKINKFMSDHKHGSIPNSSATESSSNSSNRCIRNNSYLNANHTVGALQAELDHNNHMNSIDLRPSSSSSNSSSSSKIKQKKSKNNGHSHNQMHPVQLEIINEKNSHGFVSSSNIHRGDQEEGMPDYASYEITV